ncbi:TIGR00730 family Rossman fold protein [Candidatus Gottesmanbacteria bacterium]|nr:TIGR00730 family Rossman fold protein [Candidatus Gottesmanbacteria bacterium]
MKKKIVVFAGNECVKDKEKYYFSLAYKLGKLLAKDGFIVVTGGGPGLMNEVMKGAYEHGGETIGVRLNIPGRKHSEFVKRTLLFEDLNKRQDKLLHMADGFISLPGGVGTFYEIFAVLALKRDGELSKNTPMILIDEYFAEFKNLMNKLYREGFAEKEIKQFYSCVRTPEEAIVQLINHA